MVLEYTTLDLSKKSCSSDLFVFQARKIIAWSYRVAGEPEENLEVEVLYRGVREAGRFWSQAAWCGSPLLCNSHPGISQLCPTFLICKMGHSAICVMGLWEEVNEPVDVTTRQVLCDQCHQEDSTREAGGRDERFWSLHSVI